MRVTILVYDITTGLVLAKYQILQNYFRGHKRHGAHKILIAKVINRDNKENREVRITTLVPDAPTGPVQCTY